MRKRKFTFLVMLVLMALLMFTNVFAANKASIKLSKTKVSIEKGENVTIKAVVTGKSNKVTWSSSNKKIATVNKKGVVTGKKPGKVVISAKANGKTAKCKVTVTKGSLLLSPKSVSVVLGGKAKIKATSKSKIKKIKWSTSNKKIVTVSSKGVITAKKIGKAVITAKANGLTAKCNVIVTAPTIKLSMSSMTLEKGKSGKLTATVSGKSKEVKWTSSNNKIVTVSGGTVKAVSAGTAKITAQANGVSSSCSVTVKAPATIKLNQSSAVLAADKSIVLKASVSNSNGVVTWKSSDNTIAVVDGNGKVTAKKAGTVTITATANVKHFFTL